MKEKYNNTLQGNLRKLGEVCTYSKGKKPSVLQVAKTKVCPIPYINIKAFEKGIFDEYTDGEKCNLCEDDDLLMVWDGARCGLIGKAKKGAVGSTLMKILPTEEIHKEYLYHFISSKFTILNTKPKGVGIPHIEPTLLWNFELLVPSLDEQALIVSKIEELLSKIDNGKQQLETAQQQLKVYRQSLLKAAFEGKLTGTKNWTNSTLGEICDMKAGFFVKASEIQDEFKVGLFPCYGGNGLRGYTKSHTHEGTFSLVGRQGALCGNVHLVNGKFHATEHAVVTNAKANIDTVWLFYKLTAMRLNQYSRGAAQPGLSVNKLLPLEVQVPPIKDQQKIVSELESKLTVCDKIEETITQSLQQAETLRQSILKKAFEGKLVSVVEEQQKGNVIQLPVQEFPRKVPGITETDLQAGIISMVIDLHQSNSRHSDKLSHVKCEKISDLIERKLGISLGRAAMKDAAGPDDYKHLKKVEHRANMAGFFSIVQQRIGHTYKPKRKMPQAIEKVKSVLTAEELFAVENLLKDFLPFELEHAELVATLFAGWNNLLLKGKHPTDEEIVFESRENWSKRKLTIPRENFFKTLSWMKTHDYVPQGKGKLVLRKEELKKGKTKKSEKKK
jgi:restriction endonuclease S subunit